MGGVGIEGVLPDRLGWRRRLRRDELRAGAVHADPQRFAAVYERYSQALYRYCRSIVRSHDDARDALQSAMTRAFSALLTEERDFELKPWLFRIAHNEAIEMIRRREPAADVSDVGDVATASVEQSVEQREDLTRLEADLRELSQRQRSALVLRELSGLGYAEIAEVLEITESVVKQAIHEARTALIDSRAGRELACAPIQRQLSDGDRRVLRRRKIRAHLKECPRCQAFVSDLHHRPAALSLLVPPLPVAASAELLKDILGGGGGSGVAVSAGVGASGGAVSASLGTGVATKFAVGTLIVAAAAGGYATVERGGSRPRHGAVGASPAAPLSPSTSRGRDSAKWFALATAAGKSIFGQLRDGDLPGSGAHGGPARSDVSGGDGARRGGAGAAGGPAGNGRASGSAGSATASDSSSPSGSPPSHGSPNHGTPAGAGAPQDRGSSGDGGSAAAGGSSGGGSQGGDGSSDGGAPGWAGPHGGSPSPQVSTPSGPPPGAGPPTSVPGHLPPGLTRGNRQ